MWFSKADNDASRQGVLLKPQAFASLRYYVYDGASRVVPQAQHCHTVCVKPTADMESPRYVHGLTGTPQGIRVKALLFGVYVVIFSSILSVILAQLG